MKKTTQLFRKNGGTIILILFILLFAFNPDAKAWVLDKLIHTGLFKMDTKNENIISQSSTANLLLKKDDGSLLNTTDLKGKVVFINFWATWCPPCRAEMPSIQGLYNKLKNDDRFVFIMVDADGDIKKSKQFLNKNKYDMPLYIAVEEIPTQFLRGSIPTTVILDAKGNMVQRHEGMANYDTPEMMDYLKRFL